jgi:DNA-directed RNA polymerase specialized sigma24 family protein
MSSVAGRGESSNWRPVAGGVATDWARVWLAGSGESPEALAALCADYWAPVYSFLRYLGLTRQDAEDTRQGFFAEILRRGDLARLTPERGRFRSWLRTAVRHHWLNVLDRERAEKRGGRLSHDGDFDLDSVGSGQALYAQETPALDRDFDRRWALTVVDRALARVRAQYEQEGRLDEFLRLASHLSGQDKEDQEDASSAESSAPAKSRAKSGATRAALYRQKKEAKLRYGHCLRAEIAGTVSSFEAIDDELKFLFDALS